MREAVFLGIILLMVIGASVGTYALGWAWVSGLIPGLVAGFVGRDLVFRWLLV